jgi:DNA-binding transcriptional ArsR family regulator
LIDAARVFQALGDATRRDMIERLTDGPLSVSKLAASYEMSLTAVGQHLAILERAGLVTTQKSGRVRTCALAQPGLDTLADWLAARRSPWQERLDALGDMLDDS